jgi:hypothetical protein
MPLLIVFASLADLTPPDPQAVKPQPSVAGRATAAADAGPRIEEKR